MPAPTVATSINGRPLGDLRKRAQALADTIYAANPAMSDAAILALAYDSFRAMAMVRRGRWVLRAYAIFNGGAGAIVPIRQ